MLNLLDASAVRRWCSAAAETLAAHRAEIDDLNVFPIPDGDTGTNLALTLRSAAEAVASDRSATAGTVYQTTDIWTPTKFTGRVNGKNTISVDVSNGASGHTFVGLGQKFLSDHFDSYEGKPGASERTLCGHIDLSPRGMGTWQAPHAPAGTVQNKITDAAGAEKLSMSAALGHACGMNFKAPEHLAKYPEFAWMKDILRDMPARGWTKLTAK